MDILSVILKQGTRRIATLIPSVVISEKHTDTLEITEHPVQQGAAITDHAYKKPSELVMECGFASGGSLLDVMDTTSIGLKMAMSPAETYQKLRELQESRELIEVITGKRTYRNMLIKSIEATTDKYSEHVLLCTVTLREIMLTHTETIHVPVKEKMKLGTSTSAVKNGGNKVMKPKENVSLLRSTQDIARGIVI